LLKTSSATEKKWFDIAPEGLVVWMRTFRTIQGKDNNHHCGGADE
jgi:hypothetical protein